MSNRLLRLRFRFSEGIILDTRSCSFCKEEISMGLRRCPYCGSLLDEIKQESLESGPDNQKFSSDGDAAQMYMEQNDDGTIVIKECEDISTCESKDKTEFEGLKNITQTQEIPKSTYVNSPKSSLSNGLKVFLTVISTIIPGIGQLIGIIISVLLINSDDADRNSFGVALMVSSLLFFLISCILAFIVIVAFAVN
jgi:hypothetical protein